MTGLLTPDYGDVFDDSPALDELLDGIPSASVIKLLCHLNSRFRDRVPPKQEDREVVLKMISGASEEEQMRILRRLLEAMNGQFASRVFHSLYLTYFLDYELNNFRDLPEDAFEEGSGLLQIFKAYLTIVTQYHNRNSHIPSLPQTLSDDEIFQRRIWSTLFVQHEFNRDVDVVFELVKIQVLLTWLESQNEYADFVKNYCNAKGCADALGLVGTFLALFRSIGKKQDSSVSKSWFTVQQGQVPLMDNISQHPQPPHGTWEPSTLVSIKGKPLFKDVNGSYHILNRNFLYRNVYEGVTRDFCLTSGISSNPNYYPEFKSKVGKPVIEKKVFRTIVEMMYDKRMEPAYFDQESNMGYSDAYIREGRYAILIECKDTDIPDKLLSDYRHEDFLEELRKKHVVNKEGKDKSVRQLARNARSVMVGDYPDAFYGEYKEKDLWVLPVLVVSGYNYSAPGITTFLNSEYQNSVTVRTAPLTVMTMEYFFRKIVDIERYGLSEMILSYHRELRNRRIVFNRYPDGWNAFAANAPIEQVCGITKLPYKAQKDFLHRLFLKLDLPIA